MRQLSLTPFPKGNLLRQLVLGLVAILLVAMIIAVRYIHGYTMNILSERDERISYDQMETAQTRIGQLLSSACSGIDLLMYDSDVVAVANRGKTTLDYDYLTRAKAISSRLSVLLSNSELSHSIYVYLNDQVIISSNINNLVSPYSTDSIALLRSDFYAALDAAPFRISAASGFISSDFHAYTEYPRFSQGPLITLGCTSGVSAKNGKRAVIMNLNAQKMSELLAALFGEQCDAYLLNSDSSVLCASTGKTVSSLPFELPDVPSSGISQSPVTLKSGETGLLVYCRLNTLDLTILKYLPSSENLKEANAIGSVFFVAFLLCCTASLILVIIWTRRCLKPIGAICDKMDQLEGGELGVQIDLAPRNELGEVIAHFNRMSSSLAQMDEESRQAEKALRVQEIRALRAQLNPHFIFNTLNMFKWMAIMHKTDELKECVVALAEILSPAFKENNEEILLKSEINCLKKYILILGYRFGSQIDLNISLPEALENALVPRLIMQPIVENCVHHGRHADGRTLAIRVQARKDGDVLELSVSDNGQGIDEDRLKQLQTSMALGEISDTAESSHIGLLNVHRRVALQYGRQYGADLKSRRGEGTTVSIRLPFHTQGQQ